MARNCQESGGGSFRAREPERRLGLSPDVIVWSRAPEQRARLESLAREVGLTLHAEPPEGAAVALCIVADQLALVDLADRKRGPVAADLTRERAWRGGGSSQLPALVRAVGRPAGHVVDATAGLGRDARTLAEHCSRLTLLERDPALWAILRDGLERAARERAPLDHVELVRADARVWLAELPQAERPDVVYLDPMYPEKKKSLAKRDLQMLQRLLGGASRDDVELLVVARAAARRRVVVKRPPRSRPLAPDVHHVLETKLVRFDVYE